MNVEDKFIQISALLCEPTRARMLWNLLDGRAYTASELAAASNISFTSASNHLSKLLEADLLKFEVQGRHRYYSFANTETAYVVEALATLAGNKKFSNESVNNILNGVRYCRTCYDHLAGFVGVTIVEALQAKKYLEKKEHDYLVTKTGWKWLQQFNISEEEFKNNRRPLTRQCLDWSERRPHLAGHLAAVLLEKLLKRKWFKKVQFSRELIVTATGRQEAKEMLGINL